MREVKMVGHNSGGGEVGKYCWEINTEGRGK